MEAWAQDPQQLLPKEVLLQANVAAVQAIGPAYLQQHLEQQQIDELTKAVEALKDDDISVVSRVQYQLDGAKERKKKTDEKLADAMARVNAIKLASAEAISPGLVRDSKRYTEALNELDAAEPGELDRVNDEAAKMVNVGALKNGAEVEVVHDGTMKPAQVKSFDEAKGFYKLSLWGEVTDERKEYKAGYNTPSSEKVELPRVQIYANAKQRQELSKEACALAANRTAAEAKVGAEASGGASLGLAAPGGKGPPEPTAAAYLALLYADAERTLQLMYDLGKEVKGRVSAVDIVAPLKGEPRAAYKTLDKYYGDYSRLALPPNLHPTVTVTVTLTLILTRLTDLARMTINCERLADVKVTLAQPLAQTLAQTLTQTLTQALTQSPNPKPDPKPRPEPIIVFQAVLKILGSLAGFKVLP